MQQRKLAIAVQATWTYLVVNVMIVCVVGAEELKRVPRQPVAAMVVHSLKGRHDE